MKDSDVYGVFVLEKFTVKNFEIENSFIIGLLFVFVYLLLLAIVTLHEINEGPATIYFVLDLTLLPNNYIPSLFYKRVSEG